MPRTVSELRTGVNRWCQMTRPLFSDGTASLSSLANQRPVGFGKPWNSRQYPLLVLDTL
jgi:hypothetical protein